MFAHFMQVGVLQSAVVNGDVDGTRRPARWLASHQESQFPAAAQPALEQMRAEARVILAQNELTEIASSLARMGVACGTCHQTTGGGPHLNTSEAPPLTNAPDEHMLRHVWALDRMWEGLIGPSDAAWRAGAAALGNAPLHFGAGTVSPQVEELAAKVHELAESARAAVAEKDRATLYGGLLQTCALCHEDLGMRLRH
jgi:cytochrome c553